MMNIFIKNVNNYILQQIQLLTKIDIKKKGGGERFINLRNLEIYLKLSDDPVLKDDL